MVALAIAPVVACAGTASRVVFAEGTGGGGGHGVAQVWAGYYDNGAGSLGQRFYLYGHELFGPEGWRELGVLESPVIGMSHQGNDAVVLFEGGQWQWRSGTRVLPGPSLSRGGTIISLAGDADGLWAVGVAAPEKPTTTGSTAPASLPATGAAGIREGRAYLFHLGAAAWDQGVALPGEVGADSLARHSLAVVGSHPIIAFAGDAMSVRLEQFDPGQGTWEELPAVHCDYAVGAMKVLDRAGRRMLWTAGGKQAGQLWNLERRESAALESGTARSAAEA